MSKDDDNKGILLIYLKWLVQMKPFVLIQVWREGGIHALYERIPEAALGWNEGLSTNSVQFRYRNPNDFL